MSRLEVPDILEMMYRGWRSTMLSYGCSSVGISKIPHHPNITPFMRAVFGDPDAILEVYDSSLPYLNALRPETRLDPSYLLKLAAIKCGLQPGQLGNSEDYLAFKDTFWVLSKWVASSKRIFKLSKTLQSILAQTAVSTLEPEDITFPFSSYIIEFDTPIVTDFIDDQPVDIMGVCVAITSRDFVGTPLGIIPDDLEDAMVIILPLPNTPSSYLGDIPFVRSDDKLMRKLIEGRDAAGIKTFFDECTVEAEGAPSPPNYFSPRCLPFRDFLNVDVDLLAKYIVGATGDQAIRSALSSKEMIQYAIGLCMHLESSTNTIKYKSLTPKGKPGKRAGKGIRPVTRQSKIGFVDFDYKVCSSRTRSEHEKTGACKTPHWRKGGMRVKPGERYLVPKPKSTVKYKSCLVRPDSLKEWDSLPGVRQTLDE